MTAPRRSPTHERANEPPTSVRERAAGEVVLGVLRSLVTDAIREALVGMKGDLIEVMRQELESKNGPAVPDKQLLSVDDVAHRLNIRPATVREWIKAGFLAAVPLGPAGRRYGIRPADLERALEQRGPREKSMDIDAAAIQIVKSARVRTRGSKKE